MREFKVGDKVVSEEFGEGVVLNIRGAHIYEVIVQFDSARQAFTRDGTYYLNNNEPRKNIKHKEESTMKKSDLKTGMVVEYRNGLQLIVLADCDIAVSDNDEYGWMRLSDNDEDLLFKEADDSDWDIVKVFSQPTLSPDYIRLSAERDLIWPREQVKEMTVSEISKALGYTVKVVE